MCFFGTDPSMCWYLTLVFEVCWRLEGFGARGWDWEMDETRRQNLDVCACVHC